MKLARISYNGRIAPAVVNDQDGTATLIGGALASHPNPLLAVVERRMGQVELSQWLQMTVPLTSVTVLCPFSSLVRNVICIGKNYREHAEEFDRSGYNGTQSSQSTIPEHPQIFTKATTTLSGPYDDIVFDPKVSECIDYECEVAVVIGQECRNVPASQAYSKIFGYVALNDVTARDVQKRHAQWFTGKSFDTFCPLGPWIATSDEMSIPDTRVQTWVNDELRQDAKMADLIFDIPTVIETLSQGMTLLPGDIIATGTPVGVGVGFNPPKFLRHGDRVRVAATNLGQLINTVRSMS